MRRTALLASFLLFLAASAFAGHLVYTPGKVLTDADRAELAGRGIVVQRALTNGRYLVSVSAGRTREAIGTDALDDFEPLTPARKILRSAVHEAAKGKTIARVRVMFHDDVTFDEARAAVFGAGAAFEDPLAFELGVMRQIDVLVAPALLENLAMDDRVLVIAAAPLRKIASDNLNSAKLSRVPEVQAAPYDLTGRGVSASLFELAEAQATHPEFGGRLTVNTTGGSTSDKQHATHVAGTIGAAGIEPGAKGMAPAVTLHQYRASNNPAQWLKVKDETLPPLGVRVDNNSWGYVLGWDKDGSDNVWNDSAVYFGAYDLVYTAPIDQISRQRGLLFVHSAGNEATPPALGPWSPHRHVDDEGDTITTQTFCISQNGSGTDCPVPTCTAGPAFCEKTPHMGNAPFDTIGLTASGKNSVTVGAVDDLKQIAWFSGRGPAKDGRVKPDLVARGVNVLSSTPTNSYTRKDGTSMSSPAVAGMAVLLTEQWRKTFGVTPTPEQLKALLIAGADDLGNTGPDYTYGFGLANVQASVDLIVADAAQQTRIKTASLVHGGRFETALRITEPQKLRVTLQWLDPEIAFLGGDEVAAKALVNDLDLTVTDPAGNVVRPYVLNPKTMTLSATRGTNTIDNTEIVEVANATPGVYRVSVNATAITDHSPQSFTLVTNAPAAPPCVDIQETNNTAETAHGNLVTTQNIGAALCSEGDVDFFKFSVTKGGDVSVAVTSTGDTPIRVTLSRDGASQTIDVPAGTSRTVTINIPGGTLPQGVPVLLKIEPVNGAVGLIPSYTFIPTFGQIVPARKRTVRR